MKLTKLAIEFGFTTKNFNEAMLVFLSNLFSKYNQTEPIFMNNLPQAKFFIKLEKLSESTDH